MLLHRRGALPQGDGEDICQEGLPFFGLSAAQGRASEFREGTPEWRKTGQWI